MPKYNLRDRTKLTSISLKDQSRKCLRKIPYATGFKRPTFSEQLKAIDISCTEISQLSREFQPNIDFFSPLSYPTCKYDWLAQYLEYGQSFEKFCKNNPWMSKRCCRDMDQFSFNKNGNSICEKYPKSAVYILPIGEFQFGDINAVQELASYAEIFYNMPVKIMNNVDLEIDEDQQKVYWKIKTKNDGFKKILIDSRFSIDSKKFQFYITSSLNKIRNLIPKNAFCLIALTMQELYAAESDLFVSGMAYGAKRVAIFSLKRYDPALKFNEEFWYEYKEVKFKLGELYRYRIMLKRSCTLIVHELGHLLGIGHCIYFDCCMNGSGHLEEDVRQSMHLCPVDMKKVVYLCDINISEWYNKLLMFFQRFQFSNEINWIKRRLQYLA